MENKFYREKNSRDMVTIAERVYEAREINGLLENIIRNYSESQKNSHLSALGSAILSSLGTSQGQSFIILRNAKKCLRVLRTYQKRGWLFEPDFELIESLAKKCKFWDEVSAVMKEVSAEIQPDLPDEEKQLGTSYEMLCAWIGSLVVFLNRCPLSEDDKIKEAESAVNELHRLIEFVKEINNTTKKEFLLDLIRASPFLTRIFISGKRETICRINERIGKIFEQA